MRLSTAGTLALTILLATSILGAVVAAPPVSALDAEHGSTPAATDRFAADQSAQFGLSESPAVTPSPTSTAATMSTAPAPSSSLAASTPALEPADPKQIFRVTINEDGHAQWTIETRFNLSDDDDVAVFREWAAEVAAGERADGYDVQQFRTAVANAEHATNRQMSLEDPEWNHRIESPDESGGAADSERRVGVVSYSFTWTNFARVDDDRIYLGDAFHAPDDPMLPALFAGQRLEIEYPSNYALDTPTQLSWDGSHQFEDGELEIVFVRGAVGPWDAEWLSAGLIGVGLLLGGAAAGYLAYRYLRERDDVQLPGLIASLGAAGGVGAGDADADGAATGPAARDDPGSQPGAETAGEAGTQVAFDADEDVDPELLSDEERVHRMLERNGGRMKQANIVKETGWSNAKVSQLLSQMDDDGKIEKLRIGRENLITLPEVDPTEVD